MNNIYVRLLAVVLFLTAYSTSAQEWQWLRKIGFGNSYDQCSVLSAATDDNGNTYVTGWFMGKLVLGDKTYSGSFNSYEQYFVAKFDNAGNVVWSNAITPTSSELNVYSIFLDNDGNAYVTGSMSNAYTYNTGKVNFGNGESLALDWLGNVKSSNFICKYSSAGTVAMKKFYTGSSNEYDIAMQVNQYGDMFLKGTLLDSYGNQQPDIYYNDDTVRCYNSSGQLVWKNKFAYKPTAANSGNVQLLTDNDNLWIVSQWDKAQQITFSGETHSIDVYETFLTEYDRTTGALLTVRPTGTEVTYLGTQMVIRNRKLYMLGSFQLIYSPSITFGSIEVKSTKPNDPYYYGEEGFLAKMDISSGEYSWARLMTNFDDEYSLNVSARENIYVGLGGNGINALRYVHKIDAAGSTVWTQSSHAYIHDHVYLGVDKNDNVYATGWVSNGGTASFGSLTFFYNNEVGFVAKLQNVTAALMGISLSSGTLSPTFNPATLQYTATVPNATSSITVTPTAKEAGSVIKINGTAVTSGSASAPIALQTGGNSIVIDVTAEDGSTRKYTVTVTRENGVPVITSPGNKMVDEGTAIDFAIQATDPDAGQELTYSLEQGPPGSYIDYVSGTFTWLPMEEHGPGSFDVKVRVTDNGTPAKYSEVSFSIEVTEVNTAPVILFVDVTGNSDGCGAFHDIHTFAIDMDTPEDDITYSLQGIVPPGAMFDPINGHFSWLPGPGYEGEYLITIRATDSGSPALYDEKSVLLIVNPLMAPEPSGEWSEVIPFQETATFSVEPMPQAYTYRWSVPEGFEIVEGNNTSSIRVKATNGTAFGSIEVRAENGCGEGVPLIKPIMSEKAEATVTLSALEHTFTGEAKSVIVLTEPEGLPVEILYNGSATVPSAAGEYSVTASVQDDNYEGQATGILIINTVTAIGRGIEESVTLSPNPTNGKTTLAFAKKYTADIIVTDAYGRVIQQGTATGIYKLDLENHATGIYFVKVLFKNEAALTLKVMKY